MDESLATPALAKIAAQEGHPGREIAVILLLTQATPESFAELKRFNRKGLSDKLVRGIDNFLTKPTLLAKREGTPKTTRQQFLTAFQQLIAGDPKEFMRLTADAPDGERDVITVMLPEDIPLIRKARRAMMLPATPHVDEWYGSFSSILITMVWKPEP